MRPSGRPETEGNTTLATRKYNLSRGAGRLPAAVTEAVGGAISGGVVQVTVDLAVPVQKRELLATIQTAIDYIRRGPWPPA